MSHIENVEGGRVRQLVDFRSEPWFEFLDHGQKDLVTATYLLYERELVATDHIFHDYSFLVFPMAKAYEGFLKKYFYSLELIDHRVYVGDFFRIGKALNPDLPEKYRNEGWVVDGLDRECGLVGSGKYFNKPLSRVLWDCWKQSRNLLFHYFPEHENFITLEGAGERIWMVAETIEAAMECKYELDELRRGVEKTA